MGRSLADLHTFLNREFVVSRCIKNEEIIVPDGNTKLELDMRTFLNREFAVSRCFKNEEIDVPDGTT